MKTHLYSLALFSVFAFAAAPSNAQTGLCSSICSSTVSCETACYDTGGSTFFSTCGAYGYCQGNVPDCHDPKRITIRNESTRINPTVTNVICHTDHWYGGSPYAWPIYYAYTSFTVRTDVIRVTEWCDGTVTEQVVSSSYESGFCAERTGEICSFPSGPPPITCSSTS